MTLLASSRRLTTIVKEAHRLHQIELREKEHLKFLRLLLKDFMIKYGIDTENWILIQFATALKIIVLCPWSISQMKAIEDHKGSLLLYRNSTHKGSLLHLQKLMMLAMVRGRNHEGTVGLQGAQTLILRFAYNFVCRFVCLVVCSLFL